jgi:hypothetical protein
MKDLKRKTEFESVSRAMRKARVRRNYLKEGHGSSRIMEVK